MLKGDLTNATILIYRLNKWLTFPFSLFDLLHILMRMKEKTSEMDGVFFLFNFNKPKKEIKGYSIYLVFNENEKETKIFFP